MAGETEEIDLSDAIAIASFQVMLGRAPAASQWVDGLIAKATTGYNQGFAESFF